MVLVLGWTGVECMTKACGKGNVPMVTSVRSRRRVERDERSVRELVLEDLGVGVRRVPLKLGRLVLLSLSNATISARETLFVFSMKARLQWCL